DPSAAQEYVNALAANPKVRATAVYDASGALFASFARSGSRPIPPTAPDRADHSEENRLVAVQSVMQGDTRLGTIYLRTITEPVTPRLLRYGAMALLVIMASLVVAVLGVAQAAQARANRELGRRADVLARA